VVDAIDQVGSYFRTAAAGSAMTSRLAASYSERNVGRAPERAAPHLDLMSVTAIAALGVHHGR
jgi:hypothetical protein